MRGPLVGWIIGAVEGAVAVGGLSALGAGLYSMGIPTDSVVEYETALKSDNFLVVAHGTEDEVAQAKPMLGDDRRRPSACRHVHTRGSPVEQRLRHSREGSVVTMRVMANRCRPDNRSAYRESYVEQSNEWSMLSAPGGASLCEPSQSNPEWRSRARCHHLEKGPDIASASIPDTLAALHVNPETGLTRGEVATRLREHGYNEVAEHQGHPIRGFLGKFWGLSAWMLELIMVLSAVLQKYADLTVVGALLVVNAVLSFVQEHRAAGVVEALRRRLQVSARVLREASWQVIPARELVPGDIVRVRR